MSIELVVILIVAISLAFLYLLQKQRKRLDQLSKYEPVANLEKEISDKNNELSARQKELEEIKRETDLAEERLNDTLAELQKGEEKLEIQSYGMYDPEFDFETSEEYRAQIKELKEKQKKMIKNKVAVSSETGWTVNGDYSKGEKMIERNSKLMLRAFNGECDSAISNVKWNNAPRMEERINKSYSSINRLGKSHSILISNEYLRLKISEVHATHEYQMKLYEEKEEQRRIKEQMREEQKAQKEIEKAIKDAAKEEDLLQKAMDKIKKKYDQAKNEEKSKLEAKILELKEKLKEVEEKNQRALSMAQQTKRGYVYVISNIGSFGENIYKIGMTRRLEPLDRVRELGDASVPFKFDVHAMIWSEDAPSLERDLHKHFAFNQVNKVNHRKEFFNASIKEIKEEVTRMGIEAKWTMAAEAREYQETQSINRLISENPQAKEAWLNREISVEDISIWDDGEDEMAAS